MSLGDLLGLAPPAAPLEDEPRRRKRSPFDFINAICTRDATFWDPELENEYNAFIINRGLSYGADTVIYANEMNSRPHLDRRLQYDFLINTIRPKKRFNKWLKPETVDDLEVVQAYHGYSIRQARQVLPLLNPSQIDYMRTRLNKGGKA